MEVKMEIHLMLLMDLEEEEAEQQKIQAPIE
jgi:hypothetical protein